MAYERLGEGALDYSPCRYGDSKQLFRGPKKNLEKPYIAVIGGSETYGKFIETPFPAMLEKSLKMTVANLGCVNAGTDAIANDDAVIGICRKSVVTVIQIIGAHNMSNRYYAVHPRRNDRFLKPSDLLASTFRDVDFTNIHFTRHLLTELKESSSDKFEEVRQGLKKAWVARMKAVLGKIGGKVVLLWMADHEPGQHPRFKPLGHDPMFIERWMLEALEDRVAGSLEVVATPEEMEAGFERMMYTPLEEPAAGEMLGPVVHETAARRLHDILKPLIRKSAARR